MLLAVTLLVLLLTTDYEEILVYDNNVSITSSSTNVRICYYRSTRT
ncbi:uncharacterized protein UBRO2_06027 [Ustilago bromivora]|uniref:Uncharacterized protein n=1 Tax=Ustilago bromivora TaxID=307758 RepID=A0A8H8QSL9_9BASI|nr:uncharacterized protein UBRO2_06027 [Ustilago bromivora]